MDGAVIQRVHGQAPDLKNQDRLKCIESKFTDSDKKNVPSRVQILSWKCCFRTSFKLDPHFCKKVKVMQWRQLCDC